MKKVLVVDDEKSIVKGLKFSLEQEDMEVDTEYQTPYGSMNMRVRTSSFDYSRNNNDQKIKVVAADGLLDDALGLTGAEARCFDRKQVGGAFISGKGKTPLVLVFALSPPSDQVPVYLLAELLAAA